MSIATGGGDKGKTSLFTGQRVDKDDIRVEAYGTIDELLSFIAEAKHFVKSEEIIKILETIQLQLFSVAAELASEKGNNFDKMKSYFLKDDEYKNLESLIHKFENIVNIKGFAIPGTTIGSAKIDICRTICRRAERIIISLDKKSQVSESLKKYINRLSDLLFILARYEEFLQDKIIYK